MKGVKINDVLWDGERKTLKLVLAIEWARRRFVYQSIIVDNNTLIRLNLELVTAEELYGYLVDIDWMALKLIDYVKSCDVCGECDCDCDHVASLIMEFYPQGAKTESVPLGLKNNSLNELVEKKALRPTAVIEALNEFYENRNDLREGGEYLIRNKRWDNDSSWNYYYFDKNDVDRLISYLRAFDIFYTPGMNPVVKQFSKAFYVEFKAPAPAYPAGTLRPKCEGLSAKINYVDTDILSECACKWPCVNPCVKEKIEKEYSEKIINNMITELRYLNPSFEPEWLSEVDKSDPVSLLRRLYCDYKKSFLVYKDRADKAEAKIKEAKKYIY